MEIVKKATPLLLLSLFVSFFYLFYIPGSSFSESFNSGSIASIISFNLRLPRLLFLVGIGGALSVIGGSYQVLFRNPLAEPFVLGVSSSVSLVAAVLNSFFHFELNSWPILLAGCIAGFGTSILLLSLGSLSKSNSTERIVLFGMSLNFVLASLLFLFLTYASQQLGGGSMQWLFGHIPWMGGKEGFSYLILSILFATLWIMLGRSLDAMAMGDLVAKTLGVNASITRSIYLLSSSLFLGVIVTQTGSIGFVGLVIPHAVRLLFQPRSSRSLFMYSFILGGVFLSLCDFLSRNLLSPIEFPIGIIINIVGAPLFLWLLWKR